VAAGNSNADACGSSPSDVPTALVAGATGGSNGFSDTRASFSNFGSCVKLFAPGVNIPSDWNGSNNDGCTGGLITCNLSGTSMATPHVAGTAALYLDSHNDSPATVMSQLSAQATPNVVGNPGPSSPNLLDYTGASPPRSLSATDLVSNSVHLAWTAPVSDGGASLTQYKIYRVRPPAGRAPPRLGR
jgi:subtilisin family serine protease